MIREKNPKRKNNEDSNFWDDPLKWENYIIP